MNENNESHSIQDRILKTILYQKIDIDIEKDVKYLIYFQDYDGSLDAYCVECKKDSTFKSAKSSKDKIRNFEKIQQSVAPTFLIRERFDLIFNCARNAKHHLEFNYRINIEKGFLVKIGQYPSAFDLSSGYINKYDTILDENYIRELKSALVTLSHGYAVASYTYFRRIYDHIIFEIFEKRLSTINEDEDKEEFKNQFESVRWNEKIELLKDDLPELLVNNKSYYQVLSKGIHELSEEECNNYCPILKEGIFLILDDKIDKKNKEKQKDKTCTH